MNLSNSTLLLLFICITVIQFAQAMSQISTTTACTRGFIQSVLLQKRAEKITSINTIPAMNLLNNELRVLNDYRFTCSGVLTSLLLGVDVRTVTTNRNQYPEVQVWRIDAGLTPTRVARQEIRLAAGDFSPDGVLRYNLTPSIPFQNGDFLGVNQPPAFSSVVRLFFAEDSKVSSSNFNSGGIISQILQVAEGTANQHILLSPITDPPQCRGSGFLTPEALRQKTLEVNINRVVVRHEQQRVFPDISFTCNGSITKWIVGAGTVGGSSPSSELQIWRRSGADSYTKLASTQLTTQSPINDSNVYEYVPSTPLGFQEGDILGVYQREDSHVVPYYQESTGPVNLLGEFHTAPDSLTAPPQAAEYDYPLVTVEISPHNSLNTVPSNLRATLFQASSSSYSSISTFSTSFTSTEVTMVTTVLPTSSVPTSSPTMGQERDTPVGILASAISVVLALIVVSILAMVGVIIKRKRIHKNTHSIQHPVDMTTSDRKVELQDNISCSTTEHVGDPHDKPLFGEDPPIILQQNIAYHEHIPMQQNICYGVSRHMYSEKDRQCHKFTDGDHVSGESVDAPIVLVENVAYNRQMPLHQNMWYTSSSTDTGDRFVYAYADVGTQRTHISHTLDPEPTVVENIAYGISL